MTTKTDEFNYCLLTYSASYSKIQIVMEIMQYTNHAVKVQKLQTAKWPVHTNSNYGKRFVSVCVVLRSSAK